MRFTAGIFLGFLFLSVAGCATPTPYQPNGIRGGYSEEQLEENVWRVEAKGNVYTSKERIRNMLMLRAAELTVQNGYEKFAVIGGGGLSERRLSVESPASFATTGTVTGTAYSSFTTYQSGSTWTSAPMPEGNIVIKMLNENKSKTKGAQDAQEIIIRLKPYLTKN